MAPPRAIWTGSISFGLVNAPVRMYTATSEKTLRFNQLHQADGGRIGYQKVCKVDNQAGARRRDRASAYDVGGGEFVYLTDEDFARPPRPRPHDHDPRLRAPTSRSTRSTSSRRTTSGPHEGAEKVYALLAQAMDSPELGGDRQLRLPRPRAPRRLRVRDGMSCSSACTSPTRSADRGHRPRAPDKIEKSSWRSPPT